MQQLGNSECSKFLWFCIGFVSAEGEFIVKKNEEKGKNTQILYMRVLHSIAWGKKYGQD